MKKIALIAVLLSMMTISAQAQWFDFSQNMNRAVVGLNTGLVGYRSVQDLGNAETWDFADVGVGASIAIAGVYLDFIYVTPDHRFDHHVGNVDWPDHSALTINAGYQIPIYRDYVFITPMIGFSRVTTGITKGDEIGVDPDSWSIYHEYEAQWHRHDFNYGAGLSVVPCKWFEINATCTAHAAYLGVAFNVMNYKD
jgi:opacity protein-like surface antigen